MRPWQHVVLIALSLGLCGYTWAALFPSTALVALYGCLRLLEDRREDRVRRESAELKAAQVEGLRASITALDTRMNGLAARVSRLMGAARPYDE